MNKKCERFDQHLNDIKKKCDEVEEKCIENIKCKVTKMMNTLNIDESNEISKNIKIHYMNIDKDINRLYVDLGERLSIIEENYAMEITDFVDRRKNEMGLSKVGGKDFQIETDMQYIYYPKSKTAVKVLSFIPIVGFAATNILLKKIDDADEHNSNKKNLIELENEIHRQDEDKIKIVKESISKIRNHFTDEINEIKEKMNSKTKCMKYLMGIIDS